MLMLYASCVQRESRGLAPTMPCGLLRTSHVLLQLKLIRKQPQGGADLANRWRPNG